MSFPLVFHPAVLPEMDAAYQWYEQQRVELGDDFLRAVEEVFHRIRQMPEAHSLVHQDVRRALVRRFPYGVYYRFHQDRVEVIAVYHSRRNPAGWQART